MDNLTVVIPFYNGYATLSKLINSLPVSLSIILVDDHSDVPLVQRDIDSIWLPTDGSNIRVIRPGVKGYFAGAVNVGIRACETDVLVLNQDIWFDSLDFLETIRSLRGTFAFLGERITGDHPAFGELGYVHGTFMFIRRDAIRKVGYLDSTNYPLWGNTAEYQWRVARAGFSVLPLRVIPGMHHERPKTERYGSSIKTLLAQEPDKADLFIRTPPLLSVIVPCYNYGVYLQDCINSLMGGPTSLGDMAPQTLQSFEVIIVDDCSTDNTPEYVRQIADIKKGIRAYRLEKNVGTAQALNFGIHRAAGKYITFLSADDMRENYSLQTLVQACEDNPHSFAYDDIYITNRHQRVKKWPMEEYNFEKLIWKNHIHAGIVFPKAAWQEVGGYPAVMNDGREDWAFNVALGVHGWCGVYVKQFGYLYRREGQNRTERNTTETHRQKFLEKIMNLFPHIYRGERPMGCCGKGARNSQPNQAASKVFSTGGSLRMASQVGSAGMEKLEYLGRQVSATWTGDVTGTSYVFGIDRPKGWVDIRDLGDREDPKKRGFLAKRDKNTGAWLFKVAKEDGVPPIPVEDTSLNSTMAPTPDATAVDPFVLETVMAGEATMEATLNATPSSILQAEGTKIATLLEVQELPNPNELTVEELKTELGKLSSKSQWETVYRRELEGRSRKGATLFMEERLANWEN